MTPKQINPQLIRDKIDELGVSQAFVMKMTGAPYSWFRRMLSENERHYFLRPNEIRMRKIWNFLEAFEEFKNRHGGHAK